MSEFHPKTPLIGAELIISPVFYASPKQIPEGPLHQHRLSSLAQGLSDQDARLPLLPRRMLHHCSVSVSAQESQRDRGSLCGFPKRLLSTGRQGDLYIREWMMIINRLTVYYSLLQFQCPKRHEHEKVAPRKRPISREIKTTKETLSTSNAGQDAKQQQEEEGRYYKKETQADDRPTPPEIELNGGREKEEEESEDEPEDLIVPKRRPPIGTLPAFIPL